MSEYEEGASPAETVVTDEASQDAPSVQVVRESPEDWNLGIEFAAMQWPETWGRCSC